MPVFGPSTMLQASKQSKGHVLLFIIYLGSIKILYFLNIPLESKTALINVYNII